MDFPEDDPDYELRQLLAKMRKEEREKNPNLSPPPSPLPIELQSEMKLATNLLKLIYKGENNKSIVFSPSVISSALNSMIKAVDEITREEIEMILGKDLVYNKECFKDVFSSSHLFYSDVFIPSPTSYGAKEFESYFKAIDFSDKVKATNKINDIVTNDSNKRITELFTPSDITKDVSIYLGNAATFEGKFEEPLDGQKSELFYSNPPRTIDMAFVKEACEWKYASGTDWTCLGIPYKNQPRYFFILLPNERDGLANLIQNFDDSVIENCVHGHTCLAEAKIPVFEIESKLILNNHLKEMGFNKIFDKNSISSIFPDGQGHVLDMAVHSSKIQIDAYGTYSQAFHHSDCRCMVDYPKYVFTADHPFIFFIADFNLYKFKSLCFVGTFS